jgi:heme/copper-type cytochrome/quinol oxidase subunit 2
MHHVMMHVAHHVMHGMAVMMMVAIVMVPMAVMVMMTMHHFAMRESGRRHSETDRHRSRGDN